MPPERPSEEKTEDPTPRRRREAREEGNIPRSTDVSSAMVLLASVLVLYFFGPTMIKDMLYQSRRIFQEMGTMDGSTDTAIVYMREMMRFFLDVSLPFFIAVFIFGLAGNVLQFGFLFVPSVMQPDISKLNPISGIARMFSMRSLVRLLMSIGKLSVISVVLWLTIEQEVEAMATLSDQGVWQISKYIADVSMVLAFRFVMVLIVLSILDFSYQKYQYEQDLKMSKREVEEEMKRMEGDPQIQERIEEMQREMAQQRMMQEVPEAEVVITNPTEYAVALKYEEGEMEVPVLIAKGEDHMAQRIRSIASDHHIPVVERPPLARALFRMCDLGDEVPPDLYQAVAEVLAYVYRLEENREPAHI